MALMTLVFDNEVAKNSLGKFLTTNLNSTRAMQPVEKVVAELE